MMISFSSQDLRLGLKFLSPKMNAISDRPKVATQPLTSTLTPVFHLHSHPIFRDLLHS